MTLLQQRRPAAADERTDPVGLRVLGLVLTAVVLTVLAGLAVTGGGAATGRSAGLADAGPLTARLLSVSRSLFDLTAIGAIGTVSALAWLVPDHTIAQARLRRAAAAWAWLWAMAGTSYLLASVSQVVGMPVADLPRHTALLWYGVDLPQGRAMVLVVVGASALALWIGTVRTRAGARAWALVAPALLAPLLTTGHAATASNHFLATQALLVHVLAATLWMGGLLALVVHLRPCASVLPVAVTRFSSLALVCCAAVGVSGLVGAWTRLGATPALWSSTYGGLLLLKSALLVLLGAVGWMHRRRSIPALVAGRPGAFARLATVELALMGVTVGLAVVLARTAPPIAASLRAVPPHAVAYPTVDPTLAPLGPVTALTAFRHDALTLSAVLVACGLFLTWAWRDGWTESSPTRRLGLAAGVAVTAWALAGGLAAYSTVLLSAQVAQVLVLALVAPLLLVGGLAPEPRETLVRRLREGPLRAQARPSHAVLVLVVVLAVVLQTPALQLSLRGELTHLLLSAAPLAAGLLVMLSLAAAAPDEARPDGALLVLVGVVGWYGIRMWSSSVPFAGGWYDALGLWWTDPATDQRLAGVVAVGFAVAAAVGGTALLRRSVPARPAPRGPRRRPWGARS